MRRIHALLLICLMLPGWIGFAHGEGDTVRFKKLTVPVDAEAIDLDRVIVELGEDEKFFEFLEKLPNLKKVDMYRSTLIRRRINKYAERFPDIEFGWTMMLAGREVRTDITAFSMRNSDTSPRYRADEFSILKYCKNLKALDLGHNNLRNDLDFLYDLPGLKVLVLVDNELDDITPVGSLKELEYLELFYNGIHDISPLAGLDNLIDLNICFNRIADLSPLESLTGLRRLWIRNSNSRNVSIRLDESVADALRAALPDTYIDSKSSSVEGGWREGARYEAVRRMFKKGGEYEPFADMN